MRFRTSVLTLAALAALPAAALAQSAMMSHDAMAMPADAATLLCRPVTDKDSHTGMMSMHETAATAADGTKLVCKSMITMHEQMSAAMTKAKKAPNADDATEIYQDFLRKAIEIPAG